MAIDWAIDRIGARITVTAAGAVRGPELIAMIGSLAADPDFRPELDQLVDLSAACLDDLTTPFVHQLVRGQALGQRARRAYVVGRPLEYGLVRMFEALARTDEDRYGLFGTRATAEAWLDLPLETTRKPWRKWRHW